MANQIPTVSEPTPHRHRYGAGVAFIVIGLLILAEQFLQSATIGMLFLPTLGTVFLVWGLFNRSFGLIIPGGILLGIGAGSFLASNLVLPLDGVDDGAVFLLSFAGGWFLIALLSPLTRGGYRFWPLIPGGIMAAIGLLLLTGPMGERLLSYSNYIWPLALIALGVSMIVRQQRS